MSHEDSSLLVSTDYELPTPDCYDDDVERDNLMGSNKSNCKSSTPPRWKRWSRRISQYWNSSTRSPSSTSNDRPDSLEYDYVAPNELARHRMPHKYDEKTVRMCPDGQLYLRNRYKQKI